jgi:ferrous iron transport protein B
VIENQRDRLTTVLVAPLMTCSARLVIYALLIAAFIPPKPYLGGIINLQGITLVALYLLGIGTAVVAALLLKKTVLPGQTPLFVMELPSYKWPSVRTVMYRVLERGWVFLRTAGTLILTVSVMVWAALHYPRNAELIEAQPQIQELRAQVNALGPRHPQRKQLQAQLHREMSSQQRRQSYLGRLGRWIEPLVKPLGWDWRIGCAVVASFPAGEVVVATLGVIFNEGEQIDLQSQQSTTRFYQRLSHATWDGTHPPRRVFNVPVALSIMVFFALCAQCAATLAVIKRETNSWRWPAFTLAYMTVLAYLGALLTYQAATWISGW